MLQVRTALTMFDHVLGSGGLVEQVTQQHVTELGKLCRSLPSRWGRTAEEKTGGLAASLARATRMSSADVGLSQPTIQKHVTWIEKVLAYASDRGGQHQTAEPVSFKQVRAVLGGKAASRRRRDREKRVNWTKQEVAQLLAAPIWTGCLGLDDRLEPGREVYHDAWYWLPLMLPLYGGRSSELAGLPLIHVHDAEPIPFFEIEETEDRRLKNAQARRRLPIHPELTRLGFLDYVAAMRAAGQRFLFPELDSPGSGSFASTSYKSVFRPLRAWAFPNGTASRQRINGAWKDKDVHSFRGMVSTLMKGRVSDSVRVDIIGHEGETETDRTYDEEADLATKLDALKLLSPITQHLMPVSPIRLRPADRLKHGGRRGRRSGAVKPQP